MSDQAPPPSLVVASTNPGKIAELADLLHGQYTVLARPDDLAETVEDGETLEQNSLKKASEAVAHTGSDALADDTGLFVSALGGRPGVHTARYAGPEANDADNRSLLLAELAGADTSDRRAEFRTVVTLARPDGSSVVARGVVVGSIATAERGDNGFGYDSLFVPDEGDGRTFAEMTRDEKRRFSHRARALRSLTEILES